MKKIKTAAVQHPKLFKKSKFGQRVADGVLALTKDKNIEKQAQMQDSLRRIKLQPNEIWMVKMADRITNLQPPPSYWTATDLSRDTF